MEEKDDNSSEKDTGSPLDQYKIGEEIGEGSYSVVYEGINDKTCRRVAIKTVITGRGKQVDQRLENELIQKSLRHENVVKMYEELVLEQQVFLILEFCPSGSVTDLIKKRPLYTCEIWYFIKQLLSACEYIHSKRVCHRDIKPTNLLLTVERVLKLGDFGECQKFDIFKAETTSEQKGTPRFYSPQMASGEAYSPFKSDIWCCGITLYFLVTGEYPYKDKNFLRLMMEIKNHKYSTDKFRDELKQDEEFMDFVGLMLCREESERPSACSLLGHAWIVNNQRKYEKEIKELNEKEPLLDRWKTVSVLTCLSSLKKELKKEN